MNVTVYVEGGGNVRATKKRCRQGFSALFRVAASPHAKRLVDTLLDKSS